MDDRYTKQYKHKKRKSILYQRTRFVRFGSEFSLVNNLQALANTINVFNTRYNDNITVKHALLLMLIKHYCTATDSESFKPADIKAYYPSLDVLFGFFVSVHKCWQLLFNDLMILHFLNPHGHAYIPSTRMKVFCTEYEKQCEILFNKDNA